jgi:hypothetical protein
VDFFGTIIAVIILITVCNVLDMSTAIVGATATFLVVFYNIDDTEKDQLRYPKGTGYRHRYFHRHWGQLPMLPNAHPNTIRIN